MSEYDAEYEAIEVFPQNLVNSVTYLRRYDGYNITIPHKISIIPLIDSLDDSAKFFHGVNTVKKSANFKSVGYNTDAYGLEAALNHADISLEGKVAVIGAGGMGTMGAILASSKGCKVTIASRATSIDKAKALMNKILETVDNAKVNVSTIDELSGEYDLIINATSVGLSPRIKECPINEKLISSAKSVFDGVYNPTLTLLLYHAKQYGVKYSNGLCMLVYQAAKAHEIWYGGKFTTAQLTQIIKECEKELAKR